MDDHISMQLVSIVIQCDLLYAFKNIILKGGLYVPVDAQKDCGTRKAKIPEGRVSSSEGSSLPQHPPCIHHPGDMWLALEYSKDVDQREAMCLKNCFALHRSGG